MSLRFSLDEDNMVQSTRKQTSNRKITLQKCLEKWKQAKMVLRLVKDGNVSLRDIGQATDVPKSTLCTITKFLRENNKIGLEGMVNPSKVKGGARTILSIEEEAMIAEHLISAAMREFAIGKDILKSLMSQIASNGHPMWKHGIPSDDATREVTARRRKNYIQKAGNKDEVQFKGKATIMWKGSSQF